VADARAKSHLQRVASDRRMQTAIFRTVAPPPSSPSSSPGLSSSCARLAPPPPPLCIGATVTVHGNTVAQGALIWAEARWLGMWARPVLCVCALGLLRAAIWAGAAVADGFEEGAADGVRVCRWEDGGSVSGRDLLAGVFT